MSPPAASRTDLQRLVQRCSSSLASNPDAATYRRRAEARRKLGLHAEAIADFDAALVLDPNSSVAFAGRAAAKRAALRHADAIADFDAALRLSPGSVSVLIGRGTSKRALGLADEAIADMDAALRLEPRSAFALQLRGELRRKRGDHKAAVADFDAALAVQPRYAAALAGRGAAKRALGRCAEAVFDYDAAIALEPRNSAMLSGRGAVNLELGRFPEASADFKRALALEPQDAYAIWGYEEATKGASKVVLQFILLRGFKRPGVSTHFLERRGADFVVSEHATYWAADNEHFVYWGQSEGRWKGARAADLAKIRDGRSSAAVFAAPIGEDLFGEVCSKGWLEWDGMAWKQGAQAGVVSSGLTLEPFQSFTLVGFAANALNTKFVERREPEFAVRGRVTYWSEPDGHFFTYWNQAENRWKCAAAKDLASVIAGAGTAITGAPLGEDLFGPDRLKGWHEWDGSSWKLRPKAGIGHVGFAIRPPQRANSGDGAKAAAASRRPAATPPAAQRQRR